MNKNPFVPQPSYTPQQPPLPPGPPPPQPAAQDYSAYWAHAAAHQQAQQQQQQVQPVPYNPQWSAPQPAPPPRPPPEQTALYANYGYGGQAGLHWQQQQQRQAQPGGQYPAPPPPPVPQAPPPPQPAYNPYQPAAGYPQPYVPQATSQAQPMAIPQPYPHPHSQPPQQQPQYYPPPPPQQPQQPQHQRNNNHIHHTPPHQLPPAKRQRFEGPNHGQNSRGGQQFQPPAQPQFQAPQPPQQQQGGGPMNMYGPGPQVSQSHGRGGVPMNGGRGGPGGGRGGSGTGGRGGRGGPINGNRGGSSIGRGGRGGGSMFLGGGGGGGGRGGGGGSGQAVPLRGHGSQRGFGNSRDNHSRRGGSFTNGTGSGGHQSMNRGSGRGGQNRRHDGGGGGSALGARDGPMASSFSNGGKKDENRRGLTDFRIVGLEMRELKWSWGILPSAKIEAVSIDEDTENLSVKTEATEGEVPASADKVGDPVVEPDVHADESNAVDIEPKAITAPEVSTPSKEIVAPASQASTSQSSAIPPPPSRIRIYFHTPVSADDSHPISLNSSASFSLGTHMDSNSRKGKRKKLEDDDGDLEDAGRGKRPPPQSQMGGSQMSDNASIDMDVAGRGSVAPSVAETASEGDWLMAAIVQDDAEDENHYESIGNEDTLNVSHIDDNNDTEVGDGDHDVGNSLLVSIADVADNLEGQIDQNSAEAQEPKGPIDATGPNDATDAVMEPSSDVDLSLNVNDTTRAEGVGADATIVTDSFGHTSEPEVLTQPEIASESLSTDAPAPAVPDSVEIEPAASSGEQQSTNDISHPGLQVPDLLVGGKPLQAYTSLASTVPDDEAQAQTAGSFSENTGATATNPESSLQEKLTNDEMEPETESVEQEHLPEPPASPTSNTLLSTSSGSTYGGEPGSQNTSVSASPMKVDGKPTKTPSANRLSISYAAGTRRLVIDASIVQSLKVFRSEGRIEAIVNIEKDGEGELKGILIEGLSELTKSYAPLPTPLEDVASPSDPTLPTFYATPIPTQIVLTVHLDTDRPLSEPKWVKSGDVQEWLKSMFGRMFWVAGEAADGWERKIEVVDPDPAPTIWTILDKWAVDSTVGQVTERQRFIRTHLNSEPENVLEILLRLVRGERATPFTGSSSSASMASSSISGPLLATLSSTPTTGAGSSSNFAHGEKQTHVSLAVLAIWRMALEYARKASKDTDAGEDAGAKEVEERVGEVIRCLPMHLVHKSLDGMFKEWKVEKKGGR